MFCEVDPEQVIAVHDVPSAYLVPEVLEKQNLTAALAKVLKVDQIEISLDQILAGANIWALWKANTAISTMQRVFWDDNFSHA